MVVSTVGRGPKSSPPTCIFRSKPPTLPPVPSLTVVVEPGAGPISSNVSSSPLSLMLSGLVARQLFPPVRVIVSMDAMLITDLWGLVGSFMSLALNLTLAAGALSESTMLMLATALATASMLA